MLRIGFRASGTNLVIRGDYNMGKYYIRKISVPRVEFVDIGREWLNHTADCMPHGYFKHNISADYTEDYLRTRCNQVRTYGMFSYIMQEINK